MKKIVVAMSGGVDSSVSAGLLKEQGYEVEGIFMKNWSPESLQSLTDCPWEEDQADAAAACAHLGIPFRSLNFEQEYKEKVVNYFLREYAAGRTPNPDVMCNKEVKFALFLEAARALGADGIATGHYVQLDRLTDGGLQLRRGADGSKDQSYFLYTLDRDQLTDSYFPIGNMTKVEVRALAEKMGLPNARKKDSQGICFIGHIDLKKFLMEQLTSQPGLAYLLPEYQADETLSERLTRAVEVGKHRGAIYYTIGERAGEMLDNGRYRALRQGAEVSPVYVLEKEASTNKLFLTDDRKDPHFRAKAVGLESWFSTGIGPLSLVDALDQLRQVPGELKAQVRYQQKELALVEQKSLEITDGLLRISANSGLEAVAPGQSLVLYQGDQLIGGGVVARIYH